MSTQPNSQRKASMKGENQLNQQKERKKTVKRTYREEDRDFRTEAAEGAF